MQPSSKKTSRKKILLWGAAALASVTAFRFFKLDKAKKTETVKMLTQDGQLVEVDKNLLAAGGKKITNGELQQWIQNDKSQH